MIEIKKIIYINTNKHELIVLCSNNKHYLFKLSRMFENDVSIGMQNTWRLLLKNDNFNKAAIVNGDLIFGGFCEILKNEITTYLEEYIMDVIIYKDSTYKITINFYAKPAIVSLISNDDVTLLQVDINNDYISGSKQYFEALTTWLHENEKNLEDIIWEWNVGNDNFKLIDKKLYL